MSHCQNSSVGLLLILTLSFLLAFQATRAQDYPKKEINLERLIDEIYPIQDLDINYEDLYENLAQLLANPYDINTVTAEQLRSLFVLKEEQLASFFQYRKDYGPLLSLYELQSIKGFDERTIAKLIPFIIIKPIGNLKLKSIIPSMLNADNTYFVIRTERTLEQKKGYLLETDTAQRYVGSPYKVYSRFRSSQVNDFSIGFTTEKDAGEATVWKPAQRQYGFDYTSFHFQVMNRRKVSNLIVGDFQAQFGQGLVLGGGFSTGKGGETITTLRKSNLGFMPYTSVSEAGFFRGTAISYQLADYLKIHLFGSLLKRDGRLLSDSLAEEGILLSSIANSGLHRTQAELSKRKQVNEANAGFVLNYSNNNLDAGIIVSQTNFSVPINKVIRPYNHFNFTGNQNTNTSIFLNYSAHNFSFFSEAAQSVNHGRAIIGGVLASLTTELDFSLVYRNYAPDFYSLYGNALAENTQPQNESGFYWGWKYTFSKTYSLAGYVDLFQFPWLRYRGYAPSSGNEWLIRFQYQPAKNVLFYLQAREETKERNASTTGALYQTAQGSKINYWINCDYAVHPAIHFKTRVQTSSYQLAGLTTKGFAIVQDMAIDVGRFSLSGRYALFNTDNYDNRLYIYERDVWLGFSFQPYTGVGVRSYAMVQYRLTPKIDLWVRWANTSYQNVETIGSGSETINGSSKNDIKFQIRMRL